MGLTQKLGTIPLAIQTDSSNNVGIGTTTPAERLEVFAPAVAGTSQQSRLRITQAGSISARANLVSGVISGENPYFAIETRQSASPYSIVERLRIDGNGNVGIGTTSPGNLLSLEKAKSGSGVESLDMFSLRLTGTTAIGDALNINFYNGTNVNIANIKALLGAENVAYGTLAFSTRNYYTDSLVEVLRINQRGRVIVNSTTDRAYTFQVNGDSNSYACEIRQANNNALYDLLTLTHEATSGNRRMVIFNTGGYGTVGTIISTNSSTTYNTSSDYRLKEDLKEVNGLEKVSAIKVYDFKWKIEDTRMDGVLAHELAEVLPYAVYGDKDGIDEDGKPIMQGVDYSKIVPVLVKAIQELNAKVTALENK